MPGIFGCGCGILDVKAMWMFSGVSVDGVQGIFEFVLKRASGRKGSLSRHLVFLSIADVTEIW